MNSRIEVESRPGPIARAAAPGKAVARPQPSSSPGELIVGEQPVPTIRREDRLSVDPLCETDRYRLVQSMPLPQ